MDTAGSRPSGRKTRTSQGRSCCHPFLVGFEVVPVRPDFYVGEHWHVELDRLRSFAKQANLTCERLPGNADVDLVVHLGEEHPILTYTHVPENRFLRAVGGGALDEVVEELVLEGQEPPLLGAVPRLLAVVDTPTPSPNRHPAPPPPL